MRPRYHGGWLTGKFELPPVLIYPAVCMDIVDVWNFVIRRRFTIVCFLIQNIKYIHLYMKYIDLCLEVVKGHVNHSVTFALNISETVRDRGLVPKDHE